MSQLTGLTQQVPRAFVWAGLMAMLCIASVTHAAKIELKTAAQQSAPKYFLSDEGKMVGVCVDIIESIMALDPEIKFVGYDRFIPFKRIKVGLEKGSIDTFFGMKVTPERQKLYQFSDMPLYHVSYVLASHYDDTLDVKSLSALPKISHDIRLLSVAGTGAERLLQKQTGIRAVGVRTPEVMLQMLSLKRARLAFYHDLGINYLIHKNGLNRNIKVLPTRFASHKHTMSFHNSIPKSTIQRLERAVQEIIDSGRMQQIYQKYGL